MGFKDIEYDIPMYQMWNTQIHKYKVLKRPNMKAMKVMKVMKAIMYYISQMQRVQGYQIWHSRVLWWLWRLHIQLHLHYIHIQIQIHIYIEKLTERIVVPLNTILFKSYLAGKMRRNAHRKEECLIFYLLLNIMPI